MKNRNILISGASVAGPALAYWLRRYGFNPTVVEQAPAPRPGGQAIDLRGPGREVAERMGIMDEVKKAHTGAHGMAFVDSTGKRVATMAPELLGDSGGPIAAIEILRGDLVRILYEATREHVEYLFDDSITGVVQREDGVEVTFARSAPRVFDLVVGADGLHSNVRGLVFGPEQRFVRDLGANIAIFTAPTQLELDGWELMYTIPGRKKAPGKTAALYPMRNHTAKAMFIFAAPMSYDRRDATQQKRMLADAFAGEGWEIPRLLEAMWEAPDFYFDRGCQIAMDCWSRGRTVLIGDAAHCGSPMAGNGTSMAIVGAYVLAGELADAAGDHVRAFARYESEMRDYVQKCQKFAQSAPAGLMPTSRAQIWFRNQFLRALPYMPWKGMFAGEFQRAAHAIQLKSYVS
jgi:2-polyprenyl-6-methoxyphenol hydroxylase-like FAD-dependent oxidoreductase